MIMLLELYWSGVYREVKHILLSLTELRDIELCEIERERAADAQVEGFDAFLAQVCREVPEEEKGDYDYKGTSYYEEFRLQR